MSPILSNLVEYVATVKYWKVVHEYNSGGYPFEITMNEFEDVLALYPFVPVFSYYDLRQSTTKINERPGVQDLWSGWEYLSEPDHEIAFKLGEELGVDAVITYDVTEQHQEDHLFIYLYDISSRH